MENPLDQLPALALPAEPGLWPLALGWWLLIACVLIAIVVLLRVYRASRDRSACKRAAMKELKNLYLESTRCSQLDALFARECAALLRRYCRQQYPNARLAALSGSHWQQSLNRIAQPAVLDNELLDMLESHYRAASASNTDLKQQLYSRLNQWLLQANTQQPVTRATESDD